MTLRVYLLAVSVVMAFATGGWIGHRLTAASYQADVIAEQQAHAAAVQAAAEQANRHAEELEKARAQREIVYRTITKEVDRIVDRPVYLNVCLDDDGLRVINEALTGTPAAAGEPDAAMPDADAAGRQDRR